MDWQNKLPTEKPKYRAIKQLIKQLVTNGQLNPNEQLPAERLLAQQLGVNRSTVTRALEELTSEGILVRHVGQGTFISPQAYHQVTQHRVNWHTYLAHQRLAKSQAARIQLKNLVGQQAPDLIDVFSSDLPIELVPQFQFPALTWQDFIKAQQQESKFGYQPLLQALKRRNLQPVGAEELLITGGAQQSLLLILQALLVPGDAIAIEKPAFFYESTLFTATGIKAYGATLDDQGVKLDALEALMIKHRLKLIILNPNYQNPTGQVMTLARRKAVIDLCQRYQIPIVEDDVMGWLYFSNQQRIPTLKQLDPENVIYISSLSKIMGTSTRLGWLAASPQVIKQLVRLQTEMDLVPSIMPQVMATLAITQPQFNQQLQQLQLTLEKRAQRLYQALQQALPNWQINRPQGGYYLWLTASQAPLPLQPFIDGQLAIATDVLFGQNQAALRINFARLTAADIAPFITRLKIILQTAGRLSNG